MCEDHEILLSASVLARFFTFSHERLPFHTLTIELAHDGVRVGHRVVLHVLEGAVVGDGIDDIIGEALAQELADLPHRSAQILHGKSDGKEAHLLSRSVSRIGSGKEDRIPQ